jgi:hypothetical protein
MVRHFAVRDLRIHRQAEEILRGNACHRQTGVVPEAETCVKRRIAHQDAPLSAQSANGFESRVDQGRADSLELIFRRDGNGAEREPTAMDAADLARRKGDVADDGAIEFGDERDGRRARGSQCFDNKVLRLVAVGMVGERCDQQLADRVVVALVFGANDRANGVGSYSFTRSTYSPVRVSILMRSPMLTNAGQANSAPVSTLQGFCTLVAVLPRAPGSQYSTRKTT